ncbi:ABC-2 type transport system permease protein [Haloechinothrix alba]|uniref:ABC-2 type transport system permease protein n=1 Tax=Haloechinothrix alba TaxID=664784 RepID=A0A238VBW9_9PSEU|nr:hypothetical protein [Haloechinothrix alba]SNR31678.1 ABC-2 type transport system permease protein [Haloechinothrix alba]
MGRLVKAEFRKITTTKLWWGLLIPTVLVAFGWALGAGYLGNAFVDLLDGPEARELETVLGVDSGEWIVSYFAIARSINLATLFPLVFGALAISAEFSTKTITTTFLTAPNRVSALLAKTIVYVAWGAIYGLAIILSVAIGILISTDSDRLPTGAGWFGLAVVGVLASILMTLFGVGAGALVRSVPGVITLLILYFLVVENGAQLVLGIHAPDVIGFLPNGSVNGLTGSMAAELFLTTAESVPPWLEDGVRAVAGATGALAWWLSGLVFLGWSALVFGGGWISTQTRDIT